MAQEYELISFEKGDFQDNFGNTWCNAAFKGVSEPVRWVVKDPMSVNLGDVVYGEIKDMTSKAGKPYLRFYKEQREEGGNYVATQSSSNQSSNNVAPAKKEWQPRDDNAIRAQWSIGQSMTHFSSKPEVKLEQVEVLACALYEMVDRVKATGGTSPVNQPLFSKEAVAQQHEDDEFQSIVAKAMEAEKFDMSQIPF